MPALAPSSPAPARPARARGGASCPLARLTGALVLAAAWAAPAQAGHRLPTVAGVQAAYDAARADSGERHDPDLVILEAACRALDAGGYACQVDYARRGQPVAGRYFDVVTVQERAGRWVLRSGLCLRPGR